MTTAVKEIDVTELTERLAKGDPIEVVDIRDPDAFADWHIPGATNLPVIRAMRHDDPAPLQAQAGRLPRDKTLVMVCNVGISAGKAARVLDAEGFDVLSLRGGMRGWSLATTEARVPLELRGAVLIQVRRNGKGCLSYVIGSRGEACVVDPAVGEPVYEEIAQREGLAIKTVLETHVHADHISRARRLAERCGATLMMPRNRRVTFDYSPVDDGDTFSVGDVEIEAIATPGHTGESTCYVVGGAALLTGDTLFTDSVGRPDLEKGDAGARAGAKALYESLHERLLTLPDDLIVLPAHTGGEIGFDGAAIQSTLGAIRSLAILGTDEAAFVSRTLAGLGSKPPSFDRVIALNEGKAELGGTDPLDIEAGPNRCAVK